MATQRRTDFTEKSLKTQIATTTTTQITITNPGEKGIWFLEETNYHKSRVLTKKKTIIKEKSIAYKQEK